MSEVAGLIEGGRLSSSYHFPWLAAIAMNHSGKYIHTGSGTLISHKHVIARARSVSTVSSSNYLMPVEADQVEVFLGVIRLFEIRENWEKKVGVTSIRNHPFAKKVSNTLYVNAISLLTLAHEIEFSLIIKPICLFTPISEDYLPVGKQAYVSSYGYGSSGEYMPRKFTPVTFLENCDNYYEDEMKFHNETNLFCVKGDESGSPCTGDNQLYVKVGSNWFLKGFISSVYKLENGTCNNQVPTLCESIQQNMILIRIMLLEN